MFTKLFDLGFKRTLPQAFGFYLFHNVLAMLFSGTVATIFVAIDALGAIETVNYDVAGIVIGKITSVIWVVILTCMVFSKKGFAAGQYWIVGVAALLAYMFGSIFGLIAATIASTKDKSEAKENGGNII